MIEVTITGRGLHAGLPASVTFTRRPGPLAFRTKRGEVSLSDLHVVRADRGVRVACASVGLDVDGVEHCLAAVGGLGIRQGLAISVNGGELPLACGSALTFARALLSLEFAHGEPGLVVARAGEVQCGEARYAFDPADRMELTVDVSFEAAAIGRQRASWDGTADDFMENVAWARTFGFADEAAVLHESGRGRGATPDSVMVLDRKGAVLAPGMPARPGEFARHKLLDLIGDLCLFGGPPRGRVRAERPGHGATHRAVIEGLARGILTRVGGPRPSQSL